MSATEKKKKKMKRPRVTRLVWFTIVGSYHTASLTGRISSQTARRNCRSADKKKKLKKMKMKFKKKRAEDAGRAHTHTHKTQKSDK